MYPAIILVSVLILIVFVIKFHSEVSSVVTAEGDEHDTETTSCLYKLNTLKSTLAAKKKELKTLRTTQKKECTEQVTKTKAEIERIQAKIDFTSTNKILPLPEGEVAHPYNTHYNTHSQMPHLFNYGVIGG